MQNTRISFFISLCILSPLGYSQESENSPLVEGIDQQCVIAPPQYIRLNSTQLRGDDEIWIESDKAVIENNKNTRFSGNVKMANGQNIIQTDEIFIDRVANQISSKGNTQFQSDTITINADNLHANNDTKQIVMSGTEYRLNNAPGKGGAKRLEINEKGLSLAGASYTACQEEVPDWKISASKINLSTEDNEGEAWNTVFRVKDIPVFYLPYINFPLSDQRKTGFLYPQISTSSNSGFELKTPFYWNIAPNMDATITPYYMSKRGTQLQTELRYLTGQQYGQLNVEYLEQDDELVNNDEPRYLSRFQHMGTISDNFRVFIDFSDVSDDNYLVDIGSDQFNKSDAYLWRIGELSYFSDYWHSTIKIQDFSVLGNRANSYKTLPQIEFESYQPLGFWNSSFNFFAEYSQFDISDEFLPTAERLHLETGFSFPYARPGWFFNSDFKLMHTIYQQDNLNFANQAFNLNLTEEADRTLPKVRFHTGLNFDRDTTLFFDNMTQTFEPQVQYLFVPDTNQDDIFIYDSSPLQDDFDGLFRDRRFTSVDRIAEANQISFGATSRILNKDNQELFRLSLGRITYLNDTNINFDEDGNRKDTSALAADLFLQLARRWQFQSDIQYDTKNNQTEKSQVSIHYVKDDRNIFQLSHRYISNIAEDSIEQLSLLGSFPINKDWQFVGHITQDIKRKRSLESYAGFQYESCCWALRLTYHRSINTNLDSQDFEFENRDEFDSGIMLQFVLKGLGGKQQPTSISDMLESGLFGYKRPYFLTN
ncbi:LPS-assembly protein LptD [Thalassotalea aquiviva]|uniref:LPS-assembly protein LptD n=1 Tax=Thalassotalea aquiviva TaxID=3242415 RepID=UPI00352B41C5